jgi:hypothetical protein
MLSSEIAASCIDVTTHLYPLHSLSTVASQEVRNSSYHITTNNSVVLVRERTDRGNLLVGATDPYGRIIGFLDRSRYFFFPVAPQLCSRGWVDPISDPQLHRKSGSAGNRTRDLCICSQERWPLDYRLHDQVYFENTNKSWEPKLCTLSTY